MIAAFFDIDGTLVDCNTQLELAKTLYKLKKISFLNALEISIWVFIYKLNLISNSLIIRKKIYSVLSSIPINDLNNVMDVTYDQHIKPKLNNIFYEIIRKHQNSGHKNIVISATVDYLCNKICTDLGIKEHYSTKLKVANDKFTGEWEGEILEGEAKKQFIRDLAKKNNIDLSCSFAYADHISDLPMFNIVGNPVVFNGSEKMKNIALSKKWTYMDSANG